MTKDDALKAGYCGKCAGYSTGRWLCGVSPIDRVNCLLTDEIRKRWDREHGLNGESISAKLAFGAKVEKRSRRKRKG